MKKVKFSVMCNAVYYGEIKIKDNVEKEGIIDEIRDRLPDIPVTDLEWLSDLDPDVAVTEDDIISIEDSNN